MTIYVCMLSSERYFQYWVQTTIDRTDVHVSEIAFPAITICPAHMSPSTPLNAREQRIIFLYNLMQSIHWRTPLGHSTQLNTSEFEEFNNRSLLYLDPIFDFGYTCKDLFLECTWRRQEVDCCNLLFRRLQVGSCYVFNSLLVKDADPTWPWSVADSGLKSALSIKVNRFINGIRLTALGVSNPK